MSTVYFEKLHTLALSISTSGDNTVIAAPADGYIAIDNINFIPTGAVDVTFKSGSTAISGTYPFDAKQAYTQENTLHNTDGVITCARGQAFVINLGGTVAINGFIRYRIIGGTN